MWSLSILVLQLVVSGPATCRRRGLDGNQEQSGGGGLSAWATLQHFQTLEEPWDNVKEDWSAWNDLKESQPAVAFPAFKLQSARYPDFPSFGGKWRLCPAEFQLPNNGFYNWENPYTGGKNIHQKLLQTKEHPLQKQGIPFSSHYKVPNKKMKMMKGKQYNY